VKWERRFTLSGVSGAGAGSSAKSARGRIIGHAAVFNSSTIIGGQFIERIRPGAFSRVLSERPDVIANFNHSVDMLLGRTSSGTLRLKQDKIGLAYEIDPPNTSVGRDVVELLERGDLRGSSFAFNVKPSGEVWTREDGRSVRTITEINALADVCVCSTPAYADATAGIDEVPTNQREVIPGSVLDLHQQRGPQWREVNRMADRIIAEEVNRQADRVLMELSR